MSEALHFGNRLVLTTAEPQAYFGSDGSPLFVEIVNRATIVV